MADIMQFLYNFTHWQYFGVVATIWVIADLVWVNRWKNLLGRIGALLKKPVIFIKDDEPDKPVMFPRRFLEQLASINKGIQSGDNASGRGDGLDESNSSIAGKVNEWLQKISGDLFDTEKPLKVLGSLVSLGFFVFFLLADAIVVSATLVLMGVVPPDLPPLLQRLEISILGGAVFSAVVGVWMMVEMAGDKGGLIDTREKSDRAKQIFTLFAGIVTLFSVVVMIALAVQRLISLGYLESSSTSDLILSFVLYGLLAINNSLSAALTFEAGIEGFLALVLLVSVIILSILPVLAFLLDVVLRGVYIVIDITIWLLTTPIVAFPAFFQFIGRKFSGGSDAISE